MHVGSLQSTEALPDQAQRSKGISLCTKEAQRTEGRPWPLAAQNVFTPRQEGMGQITKESGSVVVLVGALRRGMVCGRQFGVEYQTVGSDVRLVPSDTQHVQQKRGKGLVLGHLGHVREEHEKQHANQWWLYHIIPNLRKCGSYSILQRWELSHR